MGVVGCRVLISAWAGWERTAEPDYYCAMVVHEVGHIAGLPHRDDGVMNERLEDNAIWDCAHWRTFARRHGLHVSHRAKRR